MDYISLLLLALSALTFLHVINTFSRKRKNYPPGPRPLPIIGNLHLMGENFHQSLAALANTYGPIMSVKLGYLNVVVISSPSAAKQVLQKQDVEFSGRWVSHGLQAHNQHKYSVIVLPMGSQWRSIRTAMNSTMFSGTRLDATQHIMSSKVQELIEYCRNHCLNGEPVSIGLAGFMTGVNLIMYTFFSKNVIDPSNSESLKEMRELMTSMADESGAFNLADFYPFIKFDIQGVKGRLAKHFSKIYDTYMSRIAERIEQRKLRGPETSDALDLLLTFIEENSDGYDRTHMERMILDLLAAASDTMSSTFEWAMAELLKNPHTFKRAKEELAQVIGKGKKIEEIDVERLPYLQCVMKEVLRLHPPVQTLIPRWVNKDVELCGYTIPKRTKVLVNAWAIARDPSYWEKPMEFKPERFWESNLDVRGLDFELLPFGSGRRICPGMPLARRLLPTMLGSLLNIFDWKLEDGITPAELNMEEKTGLLLQKKYTFKAVPVAL